MHNLPTTPDYVPFLHEALFQMAASRIPRNVSFGQPLFTVVPDVKTSDDAPELNYLTPDERAEEAELRKTESEWIATLSSNRFPGVYRLKNADDTDKKTVDAFVVNYDHSEDNPAELTDDDHARLIVNNRMKFVESLESLTKEMYSDESRSELWQWLLWLFLLLLTFEVWMTRRLVKQGHANTTAQPNATVA